MGRPQRQRTVVTREESRAQLKARGLRAADIAHELAAEARTRTRLLPALSRNRSPKTATASATGRRITGL
jgi:hypothetical protein